MDRDRLLDELYENLDLTQRAFSKFEDINEDIPIDDRDKLCIDDCLVDIYDTLKTMQRIYKKNIERLGGNI